MSAVSAMKLVIIVGFILPILACAASTQRADSEVFNAQVLSDEAGRTANVAQPTYTPWPTYTPRPTYTPQPTYLARPTRSSAETYARPLRKPTKCHPWDRNTSPTADGYSHSHCARNKAGGGCDLRFVPSRYSEHFHASSCRRHDSGEHEDD